MDQTIKTIVRFRTADGEEHDTEADARFYILERSIEYLIDEGGGQSCDCPGALRVLKRNRTKVREWLDACDARDAPK